MFTEVEEIAQVLRDADFEWMVSGGWALDLFLGRQTRPHKDVDVSVWRRDQLRVQSYMFDRGYNMMVAQSGKLRPWLTIEMLSLPDHTIWCKRRSKPKFIELLLEESDEQNFIYRRNPEVKLPKFVATTTIGHIRILAPEIVLLFKAKTPEDSNNASDFKNTIHALPLRSKRWLKIALESENLAPGWQREIILS